MMQSDTSLTSLLFFSIADENKQIQLHDLAQILNLNQNKKQTQVECYQGEYQSNTCLDLMGQNAHDMLIVQVKIHLNSSNVENPWQVLTRTYRHMVEEIGAVPDPILPWAVSNLYHVCVSHSASRTTLIEIARSLSEAILPSPITLEPETTPFGWFWEIKEDFITGVADHKIWQRDLLLIVPDDRYEAVISCFASPFRQGFSRIELYLQKCKHLSCQHENIRIDLNRAIQKLQKETVEHLNELEFGQINQESVRLEQLSQLLMRFLAQKAAVELLLNSLKGSLISFSDHLERVSLESPVYMQEKARIARQVEQVESDLHEASVIQASAYAIQDLQRSAEANRFERASYLLGGTAALLAGISLFNSFLEIWVLALESSDWMLPAVWVRVLLSLLASISIPLAASWFIGAKKIPAIVATLISTAVIIAMVLSTVLINS